MKEFFITLSIVVAVLIVVAAIFLGLMYVSSITLEKQRKLAEIKFKPKGTIIDRLHFITVEKAHNFANNIVIKSKSNPLFFAILSISEKMERVENQVIPKEEMTEIEFVQKNFTEFYNELSK